MRDRLVIRRLWDHRVGNSLSRRFGHEIFSMVILSLPLIQEGQLSVCGNRRTKPVEEKYGKVN